ncbi:WD40 repeat-like protein [Aaosphaeria arxii CBS 175.79]|uniref:WD40 repeat-like protein n=1 Tax=Aaosphaeria arxii CBS 175.79 TaxID=1450172 RepID=A0A6A5YA16_9PLEO|nr:WD40 repeat-like protein [Aaosphaeria arxii CBS 175.79]KAF2022189.1 WD40 repeat-like protein [Aaosphaeria arxii CBS 175.79]
MKNTIYDRLLRRELGSLDHYPSVRGVYGDRRWIDELDIVNELEGHHGCVNALSWSTSGRLLASGSDDHRINIHTYSPEDSTSQFNLTTSILTGHRSNIFSVKFMPYSNDRTIVSATDDVRIFDIEHSGHSMYGSSSSRPDRSSQPRRRVGLHAVDGVTLTEGDTNAKAFRCHTESVKRIVTEDNPFFFLTCSEDGDVRQWDIRQPARAYPPGIVTPRWASERGASDDVPAPLISYSKYRLDLNTVSCSPSQPHYIAVGGAHLHCFLHDRRMLGRDRLGERGARLSSPGNWNDSDDHLLGQATQCVKKFAPNGQKRMARNDNGHITACKISDANPNELIVSWSGDWIYSFDIHRSPDATEDSADAGSSTLIPQGDQQRADMLHDGRKRKNSDTDRGSQRARSRQRTEDSQGSTNEPDNLALRVNYSNGQSEEIPIEQPNSPNEEAALASTNHFRIAKTVLKVRKQIFNLNPAKASSMAVGPSEHTPSFTTVLGFAASILPEMDDISRAWRYPVDPTRLDIAYQNDCRAKRDSARRFVQAAGTLARVLGGQLRTGGNGDAIVSRYFSVIGQTVSTSRPLPRREQFGYDFLKAIILWLDSGLGAVVEGFSSPSDNPRLPLRTDSDVDDIDDLLIPYLLSIASDSPVVDVDVSRFASDATRILHSSEKAAVITFARALKIPFADLTGALVPADGTLAEHHAVQDRKTAISKWAFKVGRGVLLNATKHVDFQFVDQAFGGSGDMTSEIRNQDQEVMEQQEDIGTSTDDDDNMVVDVQVVDTDGRSLGSALISNPESAPLLGTRESSSTSSDDEGLPDLEDPSDEGEDSDANVIEEAIAAIADNEDDGPHDDTDEDEDVDEHGLSRTRSGRILWRSDFDRSRKRERVESHIPCSPHTRVFSGHCNVRTVKDVNFFGLEDEYVVSGSDSGHVFIWDRKTGQLLNILEGDGEVVNVVQGHPYEPTMAVSGIDHTIKIFSPDAQAQRNARKGIGVSCSDPGLSTVSFRRRRRTRPHPDTVEPSSSQGDEQDSGAEEDSEEEDMRVAPNGLPSKKRMHDEYKIISQNDLDRKGGQEDATLTRAFLMRVARELHQQGDGATIMLENHDNCNVM